MNGVEKFGPYTVIQTVRISNPRWPQFTIIRDGRIVGRSLSAVDLEWCKFIERHAKLGRYVEGSAPVKHYSYRLQEKQKA